jgi:uncharacterized protein YprB with RNaseH-like and TPR domain
MSGSLPERFSRISAFKPVRKREPVLPNQPENQADCQANFQDGLLARLGAHVARNHYGEHLVYRQWYATPEMCEPSEEALRLLLPPKCEGSERILRCAMDLEKWLFLDTETTGLSGGTGTYAFLIGLAWWESGGLRVEQLFMRDHDEEHSILLEIAHRLAERPVLVTFNGKSFDWPLLQNRFRMTRQMDVPELAAHLDFLHPARQLWRLQIGPTRLGDLERNVLGSESLGWSRRDDIDSARIPEFYFEFLRTGAVDGISGVFQHNRMDLRGLAALGTRIFRMLAKPEDARISPLEFYGMSQLVARRGECSKARKLYERSLAAGLPGPVARKARHEAARLAKRERDFGRAIELWNELAGSIEPSVEALEQLALHYIRRERDYDEAARITRSALGELRKASRLGLIGPERHAHLSQRLKKRLIRVQSKADRLKSLERLL